MKVQSGPSRRKPTRLLLGESFQSLVQEPPLAGFVDPVVVGAGDDLDLPHPAGRGGRAGALLQSAAGHGLCRCERDGLPFLERRPVQAAAGTDDEGRARAEEGRDIDAAGEGDIRCARR